MKQALMTLTVFALIAALVIFAGKSSQKPTTTTPAPTPAKVATPAADDGGLVVEGLSEPEIVVGPEQLVTLEAPMIKSDDASAANLFCFTVPEGPNHQELNPADKTVDGKKVPNGTATFSFTVETPGEYKFWAHKWWCCSCGDSFRYSIDGGPFQDFITDSNYRVWEWSSPRSRVKLEAGKHSLSIANREDGFRLDRFLFTTGAHTPAPLTKK